MRTAYDDLSGKKISEVTATQLDSIASKSFVDRASRGNWSDVITISSALLHSRTYAHGLPIPESGAISIQNVADSANATVQPPGTELWYVQSIEAVADTTSSNVTVNLFDGTNTCKLKLINTDTNGVTFIPTQPLYLSNSLYLAIANAGDSISFRVAYLKVGL